MANLVQFLDEDSFANDDLDFSKLIDVSSDVVRPLLGILLQDKTTKKNIVWATDAYELHGKNCTSTSSITADLFFGRNRVSLRPRIEKALDQQLERTRKKAEVFTPVWICNKMNNHLDEEWFGRKDVFNHENEDNSWTVVDEPIHFPEDRSWRDYVDSRRLEITCGEAPYIASRYDASTGLLILPPKARVGILDRKLRIVDENVTSKEEWDKWVERAYQSCYGYEWQGDSLLIARINLLMTFHEYHVERWGFEPESDQLKRIANIIAWNLWQMDGLNDTVPYGKPFREQHQTTLFDSFESLSVTHDDQARPCKIYDWRRDNSVLFKNCKSRGKMGKKLFDFVIGNPPYQQEFTGDGNKTYAAPVYHEFIDSACTVATGVELIHPARFLSNAGSTPKKWNKKMLEDPHYKVFLYEADEKKIFPGVDLPGGVAITYYDHEKDFGPIGVFAPFTELNTIRIKVKNHFDFSSISSNVYSRTAYRLSKKLHEDHPEAVNQLTDGHMYDMSSNIMLALPQVFYDKKPDDEHDYIELLGRIGSNRTHKYIRRDYVVPVSNLDKYKVLFASADGASGTIGKPIPARILGVPFVEKPGVANSESFLSLGSFDSEYEAINAMHYLKTKFCRVLLGIMKTTQHINPGKWIFVPEQDFSQHSDIDWSKTVYEINQQLYQKYNLSNEEIKFIETYVQEMN